MPHIRRHLNPDVRPTGLKGGLQGAKRRKTAGFTLIELMVVVTILGVLATIAIPTLTLYIRRVKTAEARGQLAKMFDASAAYFLADHVDRGNVEELSEGGDLGNTATHRCPHPPNTPAGGEAGLTPTGINCNDGPDGRCVPVTGGTAVGEYDISQWGSNPMWDQLNFQQEQAHYYYYNYRAANVTTGYGSCRFTSQAFGNLDDDTLFSTFERTASADEIGVNAAVGLYVDHVVE